MMMKLLPRCLMRSLRKEMRKLFDVNVRGSYKIYTTFEIDISNVFSTNLIVMIHVAISSFNVLQL